MSIASIGSPAGSFDTPRRLFGARVRRVALAVFFVSIAVNAALGMSALVAPEVGETQSKLLGSSLCVTAAIVLSLACEPAWERGLLGPVPYAGAALGALGFALVIGGIWTEPGSSTYGKAMGSVLDVAVACAIASLLALGRLTARHRWVLWLALSLLAAGTAMVAIVPWLGDDPPSAYLRTMGVVLIGFAALAVSVPVLHWTDRAAYARTDVDDAVRFCPNCGRPASGAFGSTVRCGQCGRLFVVRLISKPIRTSAHDNRRYVK